MALRLCGRPAVHVSVVWVCTCSPYRLMSIVANRLMRSSSNSDESLTLSCGRKTGCSDIGRRAPYTQLLSCRRSGSNPEGHKNISPKHLEKPQHFRMSSPKTTQPFAVQQHPRGMLVRSNLLSLKQIEKAPETPGFLFLRQENSRQALYFEYFS